MTTLEALTMPDCGPRDGGDRYHFPCGLVLAHPDAMLEARMSRPADDVPVLGMYLPMATVAHRRHHAEQHDEMDRWRLVEILDEDGAVYQMWCECLRQDTHWHWGSFMGMDS